MIHIIMPAYNEEEGLEKLLQRIQVVTAYEKYDYRVHVVNDGSCDRTEYVLQCYQRLMPLTFETLPQNRGITEVFRSAFQKILEEVGDDDIIVTMDSDNTQNPYALIDLIKALRERYDISIASRFVPNSRIVGVPALRRVLSNGVAFILRYLFPYEGVKDYSTLFRAYKVAVIRKALKVMPLEDLIKGHGFSSVASFLLKICYLANPKVKEVPINLRYDLKEGGSGMKIFKTIWGYVGLIRELAGIKKKLA